MKTSAEMSDPFHGRIGGESFGLLERRSLLDG